MGCPDCRHPYTYEAKASGLILTAKCPCRCHACPGNFPGSEPLEIQSAVPAPLNVVKKTRNERQLEKARKAREAWNPKWLMPEKRKLFESHLKSRYKGYSTPYLAEAPFDNSNLSARRKRNLSGPDSIDRRQSGFENHKYVNELPFRDATDKTYDPNRSRFSSAGFQKIREVAN